MNRNRSLRALVLALAAHVLIVLPLFWSLVREKKHEQPPQTERFAVQFGEENEPDDTPVSAPQNPKASLSSTSAAPLSKNVAPVEPRPLPQPSPPLPEEAAKFTPDQRDQLPRSVLHHYGEEFFDLSAPEQRYILDNLHRIRKINEIVGTKLLRSYSDDAIDPDDSNVVMFDLHPDGSISALELQHRRVGSFLDELTLRTIKEAHLRYPRPDQMTHIRIRVYIVIR